jgi:RES domain-containing protein
MSIWYRAAQIENLEAVFSGDGGLYVAGRWNYPGRKVIYCSSSISLCTLEWLSHHGLSISGYSYYKFSIEIPNDLIMPTKQSDLPRDWNQTPSTYSTRDFAEKHLFSTHQYLAMALPSVMVPEEMNLIINPIHPAFIQIKRSIHALGKYTAPHRS